jgi:hypothetical protein
MIYRYILIFICVFLSSCRDRDRYLLGGESLPVVEGWIDLDDYARVLLSRTIPVSESVDSTTFWNYAIRSAIVIVSDDYQTDTLRLVLASQHVPPFLYLGSKIRGQTGGTYRLTIHTGGKTYTSQTTIAEAVEIDDVRYTRVNQNDTIGNLTLEFRHLSQQEVYYQVATRIDGIDGVFVPCLYGNFSSRNFNDPQIKIDLIRGITVYPRLDLKSHFNDGDLIYIRLRTMQKEGFDFWNLWQNEIIHSQNVLFPANKSLKTNIQGGAIGIWCGYGQNTVRIRAE